MNTQACRSEFQANVDGFSAYANVRTSRKAVVTVRFPLVKTAFYVVSVLIVLAIAKPFLF